MLWNAFSLCALSCVHASSRGAHFALNWILNFSIWRILSCSHTIGHYILSLSLSLYIELTPLLSTKLTLVSSSLPPHLCAWLTTLTPSRFRWHLPCRLEAPNHLLVESQCRNVVNRCQTLSHSAHFTLNWSFCFCISRILWCQHYYWALLPLSFPPLLCTKWRCFLLKYLRS